MTETTATETKTSEARKGKKSTLQPCFCRTFEVGVDTETNGEPDVTIETTNCTQMTNRTFAQGHDAKLVSFLVRAELDGKDIRYGRDSGLVTTTDAVGAAKMVSHELAAKTATALENGRTKLAKKAERAEAKRAKGAERAAALDEKMKARQAAADAKVNKVAEPIEDAPDEQQVTDIPQARTKAKVGRWEYAGTVDEGGNFTYTNNGGEPVTVPAGKWSPITE